nr:replication protein [Bacillus pacificus]
YSDKSKRKDGFFYKTYKEWEEEICLTERQVRYSTKKLVASGYVETALKKANGAPTVHYKLDFDKLLDSILTNCRNGNLHIVGMEPDKMSESLTENTTENTTEITTLKDNTSSDQKERSKDNVPYEDIVSYLNKK